MLCCYNYAKCLSMTSTRQKAWETKVSNAICDVPLTYVLCLLQIKLLDNVTRAHLQVAIWNCVIKLTRTLVGESRSNRIFFPKRSREMMLCLHQIVLWGGSFYLISCTLDDYSFWQFFTIKLLLYIYFCLKQLKF